MFGSDQNLKFQFYRKTRQLSDHFRRKWQIPSQRGRGKLSKNVRFAMKEGLTTPKFEFKDGGSLPWREKEREREREQNSRLTTAGAYHGERERERERERALGKKRVLRGRILLSFYCAMCLVLTNQFFFQEKFPFYPLTN